MKIYLDNCCFNRPYDSLQSEIVRMEAEAKLVIQALVLGDKLELVWSFVLSLENGENPYEEIRKEIADWQKLSIMTIEPDSAVEDSAALLEKMGIRAKDAAHVACAAHAGCDYFITTDRKLIKKGTDLETGLRILNPIEFLAILEGRDED